jgi:hypothetical protein
MAQLAPLLDGVLLPKRAPAPQDRAGWRAVHAGCFLLGGTTFIAGTGCYYLTAWPNAPDASAWLYVVGSLGFLGVDVLELRTFRGDALLSLNILLSCIGSSLYVIGSYGFVPAIATVAPTVGVWGFLIGSAAIGCSQLWKTTRLVRGARAARRTTVLHGIGADAANAVGIELSAGLGAWCFFVGTLVYGWPPGGEVVAGALLWAIIGVWMVGSCLFMAGALFLIYRHSVMGLS